MQINFLLYVKMQMPSVVVNKDEISGQIKILFLPVSYIRSFKVEASKITSSIYANIIIL